MPPDFCDNWFTRSDTDEIYIIQAFKYSNIGSSINGKYSGIFKIKFSISEGSILASLLGQYCIFLNID